LAIEKYLDVFRYKYQMEYRIARVGNPFGEGQDPTRGQGCVSYSLNQLALGQA
jgi:nucleoside-diphosphate-sugar epimerase